MPKSAEQVLEENESRLMGIPGVEGVGIGGTEEEPVILIMVRQGLADMRRKLPGAIGGYPVRVEISGEISAL